MVCAHKIRFHKFIEVISYADDVALITDVDSLNEIKKINLIINEICQQISKLRLIFNSDKPRWLVLTSKRDKLTFKEELEKQLVNNVGI